ncbi:MAG: cation transporting ATPase C-terminal domain-containing protein [Candidatus Peregrinibacteria bacterium]|nr:cation transporting ATPase C-terminal domain-containing protein [Candidatus Peregrinibacteria bacterium]
MEKPTLEIILALIFASIPLSVIALAKVGNIFAPHNKNLGDTKTILINILGVLTRTDLKIRTIYFDKYKVSPSENEDFAKMEDLETHEETLIKRLELKENQSVQQIAIAINFCHFEYLHNLETLISHYFFMAGLNKERFRSEYDLVQRIKNHPERKISTAILQSTTNKEIFAFSKGNPWKILEKCTRLYENGKKIDMSQNDRRRLRKKIETLSKNGQKVIAFASKALPIKRLANYEAEFVEREMTFLGLIGLTEPLNKAIIPALEEVKNLGIKIYILTETKDKKAVAIAKEMGLINSSYFESIPSSYLKQLQDAKITKMTENKEKDFIFTELDKDDKERLTRIFTEFGENPAIIEETNLELLKEIPLQIQKGKSLNKNYSMFLKHAFSCKIAEFIAIIAAVVLNTESPISFSAIILLDLTINLLLELSILSEKSEEQKQKTFKAILKSSVIQGVLTGIIISGVYIINLMRDGWIIFERIEPNAPSHLKASTIAFVLLAMIQIISAFNFENPRKRLYLILAGIVSTMLLYIFISFSFFANFFKFTKILELDINIILFATTVYIVFAGAWKIFTNKPKIHHDNR